MTEFTKRLAHARSRKRQAARNIYTRKLQAVMGIGSKPTTEINYLLEGRFQTQITRRVPLTNATEYSFETKDGLFRHNFDSTEIVTLNCAVVDTEFNLIYAISDRGTLVLLQESSDWPASAITQFHRPISRIPKDAESDVSLGLGSRGYYHLVSEDLSRVAALNDSRKILQFSQSSRNSFEILSALPIKVIPTPKYVKVENLTFVTHGSNLGYLDSWQLITLRESFNNLLRVDFDEKLYISRSLTRRSPSFELQLMEKMRELGFKIVHLENYKFEDQIRLFSAAKVIVGVHGAGLTGSLWAHKPLVIELMDEDYFNRCFEWQTLMNKGQYERVFYPSRSPTAEVIFNEITKILNAV